MFIPIILYSKIVKVSESSDNLQIQKFQCNVERNGNYSDLASYLSISYSIKT